MNDPHQQITGLSLQERKVGEQQLHKCAGDETKAPPPGRRVDGPIPPSLPQRRLWFLDQLDPDSPKHSVPLAVRLNGPLNVDALQEALGAVVARHEPLRTRFLVVNGEPTQVVDDAGTLELRQVDLGGTDKASVSSTLSRCLAEEAWQPFRLSGDPMLRATLFRLGPDDHALLIVVHHIAFDGWSADIFWRELGTIYRASLVEAEPALDRLPIRYADYAVWQRDELRGERLAPHLAYWEKQLSGAPPVLALPTDRPRPAVKRYYGAMVRLQLPTRPIDALTLLARSQRATSFMAMLATGAAFLYRYTGQNDLVLGTPVAGRNRVEDEGLIGVFVNTLVLRLDLSGDPTFLELLGQCREVILDALEHQDVPFEKLVEVLQPERSTAYPPLCQAIFALDVSAQTLELPGVTMAPIPIEWTTSQFDMTLRVVIGSAPYEAMIRYDSDLFDHATAVRMLRHYRTLLDDIAQDPDRRLSQLRLMAQPERQQILIDWNDTRADYPRDQCIHELFRNRAKRRPDAVAVVLGDDHLTYAELDRRANQLAHHLSRLGVAQNAVVGICIDRSIELIVGLLAILKAGGAYLPLNGSDPEERLKAVIEDAEVAILLTQRDRLSRFPTRHLKTVCVDRDRRAIEDEPRGDLPTRAVPEELAYVMYTSGSTGEPKGVAVPHRAVVRLVINVTYVHLDSEETLLAMAPTSFDASTFEIWGALLHGGRCVLFPEEVPTTRELGKIIAQHGITTMWLTSSLFNSVIDEAPETLLGVKQLLTGGEALSVPHVRRAHDLLPGTRIINGYGPTEGTTFSCCYAIPKPLPDDVASIPIGRPIANSQAYILDPHLEPVPVGVPGELYIGGDGLARGYLNQPGLTAESFVPDPFGGVAGARIYRTGDIARFRKDGTIEFLGRNDQQVKVRGFRIELGEVEAMLRRHPSVHSCFALVQGESAETKRLVACVVPTEQPGPTPGDLKTFLKDKLPQHMVPSAFIPMESLPLLPSGKVNRKTLPTTSQSRPGRGEKTGPPSASLERAVADIWEEVLDLERVGVNENFFDLGGHSLLAVKLFAQLERELQTDLPMHALFESPTVAGLAEHIRKRQNREQSQAPEQSPPPAYLVELQAGHDRRPVFFLPGGAGGDEELLVYARLMRLVDEDYPCYGLKARSADGLAPAHPSVEEMAADYLEDIRAMQPAGPYSLVGECLGGIVVYEIARQLVAQGQQIGTLVLIDAIRPTFARRCRRRFGIAVNRFLLQNYYWKRVLAHREQARELPLREVLAHLWSSSRAALRRASAAMVEPKESGREDATPVAGQSRNDIRRGYPEVILNSKARPFSGDLTVMANEILHQDDPTLGWTGLVHGQIITHKLRGDHAACIREHAHHTATVLRECLEKAERM